MNPDELNRIVIACLLASAAGSFVGHILGRRMGRAEGWVNRFLDATREERARHRANGEFKTREERRQ